MKHRFGGSLCYCWRRSLSFWRRHLLVLLVALLVFAGVVFGLVWPQDTAVLDALGAGRQAAPFLAECLSRFGEFQYSSLGGAGALWLFGKWRRRPYFKRLAMAAFCCSVLASVSCNVLKYSFSRPRPKHRWDKQTQTYSRFEDRFYGPPLPAHEKTFNSFPSGHTSSAFGMAVPLAIAAPPVGVPALVVAGGVGWSRMEKNHHYLSDVCGGVALGLFFGVPVGLAFRCRLRC